ncbi:hypothetical protein [Litorimonas sp.]|uniref:hypothetical protein n=1 Tax=Litorimonas sp. TaxID=1892381 RepID=UPI003A893F88
MSDNESDNFSDRNLEQEFKGLETKSAAKVSQSAMEIASGSVPFIGGLISWIASNWSEQEQSRVNAFFLSYLEMLQDELREKHRTMGEIISRIDLQDEEISDRVSSSEYQKLFKKAFRNWNAVESETKQKIVRNILANAAVAKTTSDDVVSLFLDWISLYSEFHFEVISAIYNNGGISRGEIWKKLEKQEVREDSAEADLFKLVIRDLSTGSVVRQYRETDAHGNFIKRPSRRAPKGQGSKILESAFENTKRYELTGLGKQFVHYAMTEIVPVIEFDPKQI